MTAFPSYAIAAAGTTVPRTMPTRYNDLINVKDFGALGDGSTDDTNAILNAVIASHRTIAAPNGGATLFFPRGTYRVSRTLDFGPSVWLTSNSNAVAGVTTSLTCSVVPPSLLVGCYFGTSVSWISFPFAANTHITSIVGNTINFSPACINNMTGPFPIVVNMATDGGESGTIVVTGVGKSASIIRGNIPGWCVQVRDLLGGGFCQGLHNLCIWNENTASGTGAYLDYTNMNPQTWFSNCKFIGFIGALLDWNSFGISVDSCEMYCSNLVSTALATGPPPAPAFPTANGTAGVFLPTGSVGMYFAEGAITHCTAVGFDIGFALSQNVVTFRGCRASRCNIGCHAAWAFEPGYPSPHLFAGQPSVLCNIFDRCNFGIVEQNSPGARFANLCCGNLKNNVATGAPLGAFSDGIFEPAAISQIVAISGGTSTITTAVPHGIALGSSTLELILSPATLTPDGSGNQNVAVTVTNASQFTYTGATVSGTFPNPGTWNFTLRYGVAGSGFSNVWYCSNILSARNYASFMLMDNNFTTGAMIDNFICSTQGPAGWVGVNTTQQPNQNSGSHFTYAMCGLPASNPLSYLPLASLANAGIEGKEVNIVDAAVAGFGDDMLTVLWTSVSAPAGSTTLTFSSVPAYIAAGWLAIDPYSLGTTGLQAAVTVTGAPTATTVPVTATGSLATAAGTQVAFYRGGGSNHYKVRYNANSATWKRTG